LHETVKFAKENGFTHFSTTLNLSPYKDINFINELSKKLAEENNLQYLEFNFDKQERFELLNKAKRLAQHLNLYHQKYCGCVYSMK
jgi:epoxyqueuosine reductase